MQGRSHTTRLITELDEVRTELAKEIQQIEPEEFGWAPRTGMKTFKQLLMEIGTMEKLCAHWLNQEKYLDWKEAENALEWRDEASAALKMLEGVRAETKQYLNSSDEERLQTPIPLPQEWHQYWGPTIEPEEMIRWIARHEYYHLGQIISYRWAQGHDPYKPA